MGRNCKEVDYQRAEIADIERGKRERCTYQDKK